MNSFWSSTLVTRGRLGDWAFGWRRDCGQHRFIAQHSCFYGPEPSDLKTSTTNFLNKGEEPTLLLTQAQLTSRHLVAGLRYDYLRG